MSRVGVDITPQSPIAGHRNRRHSLRLGRSGMRSGRNWWFQTKGISGQQTIPSDRSSPRGEPLTVLPRSNPFAPRLPPSYQSPRRTSFTDPMRRIAVIIGAGPGLGASVAQALSSTHSLLLLSRSLPGSLPKLNLKIPDDKLIAASSDGSKSSLDEAIKKVKERWPDGIVDVGVFNTGGRFTMGNFLDWTLGFWRRT